MKIPGYFINLDSATARSAHMRSEADRLGLPLSRQPAVNGHALGEKDRDALHRPDPGMHVLSGPEIGCFLSHREIWKKIAAGRHRFGAVFEDDVAFADDAGAMLNDDSWLPSGAELVKIETVNRKALILEPFLVAGNGRRLGRLASRHLGAGGYILARTFAAELLDRTERFGAPVDYVLFDQQYSVVPETPIWQMFPAICVQQLRSRRTFLPEAADPSGLDTARKVLKRKGWAKVRREVARPFIVMAGEMSGRIRARRLGGKWLLIDFKN